MGERAAGDSPCPGNVVKAGPQGSEQRCPALHRIQAPLPGLAREALGLVPARIPGMHQHCCIAHSAPLQPVAGSFTASSGGLAWNAL